MRYPEKEVILTNNAPKAIGPYSVGIRAGNLVFTAGQLGIDPKTNELVQGGIENETSQALQNLRAILEESGSSLDLVLKTTVFLRDMSEFSKMNAVYAEFFQESPPSRTTVQVAALPKAAAVEIEAIALAAPSKED